MDAGGLEAPYVSVGINCYCTWKGTTHIIQTSFFPGNAWYYQSDCGLNGVPVELDICKYHLLYKIEYIKLLFVMVVSTSTPLPPPAVLLKIKLELLQPATESDKINTGLFAYNAEKVKYL